MTSPEGPPTRAEKFGEYVLAAARQAGYDVDSPRGGGKKALADAAGMSHASVSRMLAGRTIPDPTFFEALAHALGVRLGELLVRSGLASRDALGPEEEPLRRPISPREAAADLGLKDPAKIQLFETMVRALLTDQNVKTEDRNDRGRVA